MPCSSAPLINKYFHINLYLINCQPRGGEDGEVSIVCCAEARGFLTSPGDMRVRSRAGARFYALWVVR